MTTALQILHIVGYVAGFAAIFGPIVFLTERAHRRALATGRSVRAFPDDADERRVSAELEVRAAEASEGLIPLRREECTN